MIVLSQNILRNWRDKQARRKSSDEIEYLRESIDEMNVRHFRWLFSGLLILLWTVSLKMPGAFTTIGMLAEQSSDGYYLFAGGTHPWALAVALLTTSLYALLMTSAPAPAGEPLPGVLRRFAAFGLDLVVASVISVPIIGLLPTLAEWKRTQTFAWTFERTTPAMIDLPVGLLSVGLGFLAFLFYYAIPLTRGRPSPGACIVGYQVVTDGGGALTLRQALLRTALGFIAVCVVWSAPFVARDPMRGKFWLDQRFDTHAVRLN